MMGVVVVGGGGDAGVWWWRWLGLQNTLQEKSGQAREGGAT